MKVDLDTSEPTRVESFVSTVEALVGLLELPADWDSYGGSPISWESVTEAASLLAFVMSLDSPAPWVVPLSGGGVQLEWRNERFEIEVEIPPASSGEISVYVTDCLHGKSSEFAGPAAKEALLDALRQFERT